MLQVKELNQYYGGSHILRSVNFEARIGEVTCLLGRNGVVDFRLSVANGLT